MEKKPPQDEMPVAAKRIMWGIGVLGYAWLGSMIPPATLKTTGLCLLLLAGWFPIMALVSFLCTLVLFLLYRDLMRTATATKFVRALYLYRQRFGTARRYRHERSLDAHRLDANVFPHVPAYPAVDEGGPVRDVGPVRALSVELPPTRLAERLMRIKTASVPPVEKERSRDDDRRIREIKARWFVP